MNSLWTTIFTLLQSAFWYVLVPYLLYAKVFLLYRNFYFYANQKDKVVSECTPLPIVAHVPWLLKYWRSKNSHPIDNFVHPQPKTSASESACLFLLTAGLKFASTT